MFLASDVIKRHFGAHTESQENSLLPVPKHFFRLCLAKIRPKSFLLHKRNLQYTTVIWLLLTGILKA